MGQERKAHSEDSRMGKFMGVLRWVNAGCLSWDQARRCQLYQVKEVSGGSYQGVSGIGVFYEDKIRYKSHNGSQVRQGRGSRVYMSYFCRYSFI